MASRVNVKFVVLLAVVLGVVFVGVAGTAWYVTTKTANALAVRGDAAMDKGNYDLASFYYSKAVNKDQANIELLNKWRDALEHKVPQNQVEYSTDYSNILVILQQLANVKRTDVAAHREYLDEFLERIIKTEFSRPAWEQLLERTNTSLRQWALYDDQNQLTPTAPHQDDQWQTIRRYSGIAIVTIMNERLPLEDSLVRRAREDLEAAIDADPSDALAIRHLALWHFNAALDADDAGDPELADQERAEGLDILDSALRRMPGQPDLMLRRLAGHIDTTVKGLDIDDDLSNAEQAEIRRQAVAELDGELDEVERAMLDAGPDQVDPFLVSAFDRIALFIDPQGAPARTDRLIAMLLEADPTDFDTLRLKASIAERRGQFADAVGALQTIVDLPPMPVSLKGLRQNSAKQGAIFKLISAETALAYENRTDEGPDQDHLAMAVEYRDKLREFFAEDSPIMTFADAKIAYARGDLNNAQRLLVDYNRATGREDPVGLLMAADIAGRVGQPGSAIELYERLIELQPNNVPVMLRLADAYISIERYDEALKLLREVASYVPNNEAVAQRLKALEAMQGELTSDDPVLQTLVIADGLRAGRGGAIPKPEEALGLVEQAIDEHGPEARLVHLGSQILIQLGRNDEAAELIERGLAENPGSPRLLQARDALAAADSLETTLELIDAQGLPEAATLVNKYIAAQRFGEEERADEFLDRAQSIAPENPAVVEQLFFRAIRSQDLAEADRLADVAARINADRADGLVFRAHVMLQRGQVQEAADALRQATEAGTATSQVWRLLGDTRFRLGQLPGAIDAYAEALRLNPNDVNAVTAYVVALANTGNQLEGLRIAREYRRFAARDPRLLEAWLRLEGSVGDKRMAIERRRQIADREPDNAANKIALAELLIDAQTAAGRDEARQIVKALRATNDSIALVGLTARIHADEGDMQAAVDDFRQYLAGLPEEDRTSLPMIALGQFLSARGRGAEALQAYQAAREYPDTRGIHAELYLARELSNQQRFDEALEAYDNLLASGYEDDDGAVRKSQAMILLAQRRLDEAEAKVDALGDLATRDLDTMLLRADLARARGDTRLMRERLDQAVAAFRDQPLAYFRRAEALKTDGRYTQDVLHDLDTAISMNPSYIPALRLRAAILLTQQGREEDGLDDLRAAVAAAPGQDATRTALMNELIKRGRAAEAQNIANDAVKARPGDPRLLLLLGDTFANHAVWNRAEPYYAGAWKLQNNVAVLERYAEALLQNGKPDQVAAILNQASPEMRDTPAALMVRARMQAAQGNLAAAESDAEASLQKVEVARFTQQAWYDKVRNIFADNPAALLAYLHTLSQSYPDNQWLAFFAARLVAFSPQPDAGVRALEQLSESDDPEIRFEALSLRSDILLRAEEYEQAADVMREALAIQPDHVLLNNNLAFLLADRLGRPEEALDYARSAVEAAPTRVTILDTLAATYQALGRYDDARDTLIEALRVSLSDSDRATALVRLIDVEVAKGSRAAAADRLDQLRNLANTNPQIEAQVRDELRRLDEEVNR